MANNQHEMSAFQRAIAKQLTSGRIPSRFVVSKSDAESLDVIETLLNLIDSAVEQGIGQDDAEIITERAYRIARGMLRMGWQFKFHDSMYEWFAFETTAMREFVGVDSAKEYAGLTKVL